MGLLGCIPIVSWGRCVIQHQYPTNKDIFLHNHNTVNTSKNFSFGSKGNVTFSFLCIKNEVGMDVY